jgi:hypothetical protein
VAGQLGHADTQMVVKCTDATSRTRQSDASGSESRRFKTPSVPSPSPCEAHDARSGDSVSTVFGPRALSRCEVRRKAHARNDHGDGLAGVSRFSLEASPPRLAQGSTTIACPSRETEACATSLASRRPRSGKAQHRGISLSQVNHEKENGSPFHGSRSRFRTRNRGANQRRD